MELDAKGCTQQLPCMAEGTSGANDVEGDQAKDHRSVAAFLQHNGRLGCACFDEETEILKVGEVAETLDMAAFHLFMFVTNASVVIISRSDSNNLSSAAATMANDKADGSPVEVIELKSAEFNEGVARRRVRMLDIATCCVDTTSDNLDEAQPRDHTSPTAISAVQSSPNTAEFDQGHFRGSETSFFTTTIFGHDENCCSLRAAGALIGHLLTHNRGDNTAKNVCGDVDCAYEPLDGAKKRSNGAAV